MAAPGFTGIVELHNTILFYLIVICIAVFWILFSIINYYNHKNAPFVYKYMNHGTILETVWTIIPALVLVAIAFPSFRLLYLMDEVISPTITIKIVGLLKNGLKSYILNKKKDTWKYNLGQNNLILTPNTLFPLKILHKNQKELYRKFILGSNVFFYGTKKSFHTHCRAKNRIGPHNIDVLSVIFGLMLGDGFGNNRSGEGVRFCIKQSIVHKEYLFSLYEFFLNRGYCSNNPPRKYTRMIKGINKTYYGFEFNTFTFRSFVWIYDLFYKKGKKIVSLNIENYITPLTLAIWISDDGTFVPSTGGRGGIRIACNSFTLIEVEYLTTILRHKFDLDCTIQKIYIKDKYSIYIKKNSIIKLENLILPYLHVSMYYKLGLQSK